MFGRIDWKRYAGPEGYVKNQGFYLYRNRRLIVHGTWFRLARQQELTRLSRVRIDIPNSLDAEWKIDVKKASAQPPAPVRERLRRIIDRIGTPSRRTYTRRGARLTDESRLPVWTRSQDKNRISYGLNLDHPLFSAFEDRLDEEAAVEFRRLTALVASTLPVEALYADVSASSESTVRQALDKEDFEEIVQATWRLLQETGLASDEIEARMRSAEPFGSRWAETMEVLRGFEAGRQEKP